MNTFNHVWTYQVSYIFLPLVLFPLVLFQYQAEHVTDQFRHLFLVAPWLMEGTLLPTVLIILVDIPSQCTIVKDLITDVLVGQIPKGLPSQH